ncbi:MAG: serine acetyltransferase [Bacteroidales bacterium]|jgi:serine O-acetyltransferase|nr:serine acetyltransferase [Bacteroidales bacterium]
MIKDKKTYLSFLEEDKKVNSDYYYQGLQGLNPFMTETVIWKFQKTLRMCEYLYAVKSRSPFFKLKKLWYAYRFKKLSIRLGYTIWLYTFGPGLRILHRGTIMAGGKVGANCIINTGVVIGNEAGFDDKVPTIGDNVYIGVGAKIIGDIYIADGCAIGANAVVNKSFTEPNTVIAGVPARAIGKVNKNLRH